jgi:hypothetical protein
MSTRYYYYYPFSGESIEIHPEVFSNGYLIDIYGTWYPISYLITQGHNSAPTLADGYRMNIFGDTTKTYIVLWLPTLDYRHTFGCKYIKLEEFLSLIKYPVAIKSARNI